MKDLSICKLCDIYGKVLTEKQREMIAQYYDLDCSLAEIAENFSVSRQAVHYAIKLGCDSLVNLEKEVKVFSRMNVITNELSFILEKIEAQNTNEAAERLKKMIETLRSNYGVIQQPE